MKLEVKMKLKILICNVLLFFSLNSIAQTKLKFTYDCSTSVLVKTQVSVCLKDSNNQIELLNDTVRKFENSLTILSKATDYILSVEFKNKTIGKETLDYPFSLVGNETDIAIDVRFYDKYDWFDKKKSKDNCHIEVIKYYISNNIEIQYLPKMKGDEYYKAPFFMLKNNSRDTIYGQYIKNYFWGSISFLLDSVWSRDYFGMLDYNFGGGSPLFPDSLSVAWVGSFGWRNELPKNRYKYTLLYTTDKNKSTGVRQYLEKDNFVWWADTKKYYRLIYEFDVE